MMKRGRRREIVLWRRTLDSCGRLGGCLHFEEGGDERIVVAECGGYRLKRLKVGFFCERERGFLLVFHRGACECEERDQRVLSG